MKTMVDFYDAQTFLTNLACAEMMLHYRVPHAGTSASGEGWGPDLLAAGNMWVNHVTSCIGKVGLMPFCGSSLNSKAWSPALTVYGNDVIAQARLFAEGFGVDAASVGVSEIVEAMATERHFLTTPTTLERYRDAYFDGIFPHLSLERWEELEHPRTDRLLRERTKELLRDAEPPEDHDEIVARGEAFIAGVRV
jgi:trimethylamine--corrinoid protein Co-methyltransferase